MGGVPSRVSGGLLSYGPGAVATSVAAMPKKPTDGSFARHEKVVARVDLPGVPTGTHGRIMLKGGFRWDRYRVRFDNGVEASWVERDQIARTKDFEAATD